MCVCCVIRIVYFNLIKTEQPKNNFTLGVRAQLCSAAPVWKKKKIWAKQRYSEKKRKKNEGKIYEANSSKMTNGVSYAQASPGIIIYTILCSSFRLFASNQQPTTLILCPFCNHFCYFIFAGENSAFVLKNFSSLSLFLVRSFFIHN